ncbi:hypothetical protein [Fibrivirga algicola]|uniref:O-antigen ligase domain-containing protein n=1 Tax=Fibrivirga algicola TaxID=2950420 RepID=A0ABX0QNC3_9BACT|nr:hypothetical protein [Fibrivirga algicola]NID12283.1 hypothetical protein [Fibrivirga algicola]
MICIILTVIGFVLFIAKRYLWSLLIFFCLLTNGYQLIPSSILMLGSPLEKSTDVLIFYVIAIFVCYISTILKAVKSEHIFKWMLFFLLFVTADAIYSIFVLSYDISGVVKVFRNYLFILSFGVLILVPVKILNRVFNILSVITIGQSVLYLLQIVTGLTLLQTGVSGGDVSVHDASETGLIRFYNLPLFLLPVLLNYLFNYKFKTRFYQIFTLGILLLAVVAPLHRSYIFTTLLVISVYIMTKQSFQKKIIYVVLTSIVLLAISTSSIVGNRLMKGADDMTSVFSKGASHFSDDTDANSFAFRLLHLTERFDYIYKEPSRYFFGIGLLSESAKQISRMNFDIGTYNKKMESKTQVDTSDISWSVLLMHLGFVGTFLFIILNIKMIKYFYRYHKIPYSEIGILVLVSALFTSFAGIELLSIAFRVILIFFIVIVLKQKNKILYLYSIEMSQKKESLLV